LSGTFGELRGNHFHSGIDIKTQGVTGKDILAAADGYVSRIKISPWGYGKALYIKHPNGYTTVYGHLKQFNQGIDSLVRKEQYRRHSFAMDYYPKAHSINVKQGEVVAFSGNSGGSGGPHLHFEIRDAQSRPLNPMNFGITVADNRKPEIFGIRIYSLYPGGHVLTKSYKSVKGRIDLNAKDTLTVSQNFYLGVGSYDRQNGANNKNGVYGMEIRLDSALYFSYKANRLVFSEKRYINAFFDFASYYETAKRYVLSRILPGNRLSIYGLYRNKGLIQLRDNNTHRIDIEVFDHKGNTSHYAFYVQKEDENAHIFKAKLPPNLHWEEEQSFREDFAYVNIPSKSLYEDIFFSLTAHKNPHSKYSPLIKVGSPLVPLHKYITLGIKVDSTLSTQYYKKAAIISLTKKGRWYYEGGKYSKGYVEVKTRSFGDYFIAIDTIAPILKAINVFNGKSISGQQSIDFEISDNLSGIKTWVGNANNKWVLADYDPKRKRLSFPLDSYWPKGKIKFSLLVIDDRNNRTEVHYELQR
jgi:hypothetical protein